MSARMQADPLKCLRCSARLRRSVFPRPTLASYSNLPPLEPLTAITCVSVRYNSEDLKFGSGSVN